MEEKGENHPPEQEDKLMKTIQGFVFSSALIVLNGFLFYYAMREGGMPAILQLLLALAVSAFFLWKR